MLGCSGGSRPPARRLHARVPTVRLLAGAAAEGLSLVVLPHRWWQERAAKAAAGLEPAAEPAEAAEGAAAGGDEEAPAEAGSQAVQRRDAAGGPGAAEAGDAAAEQALRMGIPTQTSLIRRVIVSD